MQIYLMQAYLMQIYLIKNVSPPYLTNIPELLGGITVSARTLTAIKA